MRANKVRNNLGVLKPLKGLQIGRDTDASRQIQRSQVFLAPVVVLLRGWREVGVILRQAVARKLYPQAKSINLL